MNRYVLIRNSKSSCCQPASRRRSLAIGPDLEIAILEMCIAVAWFERRMRNEGVGVRGFHDLSSPSRGLIEIAIAAQSLRRGLLRQFRGPAPKFNAALRGTRPF